MHPATRVGESRLLMSEVRVTNPGDPGMGDGKFGWRADEPTKFYSAPANRNKEFIVDAIFKRLSDEPDGVVVEIGSGSGQHMAELAPRLPNLRFQPTEFGGHPNPHADPQDVTRILASISAYCAQLPNVLPPVHLDATELAAWKVTPDGSTAGLLAINVIHVSPPAVLEGILQGAGKKLRRGGWLFFYGPFSRDGVIDGDGNLAFHESLQKLNPQYGLCDVTTIAATAATCGLELIDEIFHEASDNYVICLRKH